MTSPRAAPKTALLTTFRRDGRPVTTIVSVLREGDLVYFITPVDSGKVKRLARDDRVELTACSTGGRPVGPITAGRARPLQNPSATQIWSLLRPTRALFWSFALFRIRGQATRIYKIQAAGLPRRHAARADVEQQES
jgi:uncharacterized protein